MSHSTTTRTDKLTIFTNVESNDQVFIDIATVSPQPYKFLGGYLTADQARSVRDGLTEAIDALPQPTAAEALGLKTGDIVRYDSAYGDDLLGRVVADQRTGFDGDVKVIEVGGSNHGRANGFPKGRTRKVSGLKAA